MLNGNVTLSEKILAAKDRAEYEKWLPAEIDARFKRTKPNDPIRVTLRNTYPEYVEELEQAEQEALQKQAADKQAVKDKKRQDIDAALAQTKTLSKKEMKQTPGFGEF
ncbi:hypothetical protein G3A39_42755 [Paraburkholderia aspalathi]|nr:hypothetical protein [Paraburkholderia aspalathi]